MSFVLGLTAVRIRPLIKEPVQRFFPIYVISAGRCLKMAQSVEIAHSLAVINVLFRRNWLLHDMMPPSTFLNL
jgi:hypothetical protein